MKKLNVAIIGQGRSGRNIHGAYFLTEHGKERFNVVAVADWMEERREKAVIDFGCDVYEDYTEFYKRDDIDFVVNASYSYEHYPITLDLLEHKMNVVVEKPFSRYAIDCERMIKAAKDNGVMLTVFQNSRFAPYYARIKEIIASGKLGEIQQISINFDGFSRRWDWQCSKRMYGGNLLNTGPHPMDQAVDLMDVDDMPNVFSVLKKCNSAGDTEDYVKIILTHPNRPLIDVEISSCYGYPKPLYMIYGSKGCLQAIHGKVDWKYHEDKPMPELQLETLVGDDGVSPVFCSEKLEWNEFSEELNADVFKYGSPGYYQNIYDHLTNGAELVVNPEKVVQQIRIMELVHAQNPMETKY